MPSFLSPQSILSVRLTQCPPYMIKEWHDQPSASALESAGSESAACCLVSLGRERSGVGMTKILNSNQSWLTSHVSAQAGDTIGFDGLKVRSPQGCEGWLFERNEWVSRKLCIFFHAGVQFCILKLWHMKRRVRKLKTSSVRQHSFCPSSPALYLFIAQSQTSSLPCFLYIWGYLFSQTVSLTTFSVRTSGQVL